MHAIMQQSVRQNATHKARAWMWTWKILAVLMWDVVAYFLEELEYVWKGRWSFVTLLYAVTRYGILLELQLQLYFPTRSLLTTAVSRYTCMFRSLPALTQSFYCLEVKIYWILNRNYAYGDTSSCSRYIWLQNVVDMFFNFMFAGAFTVSSQDKILHGLIPILAVLCLRTWAIYRRSWLPNIAVFVTSLSVPCLNIVSSQSV